MRITDDIKYVGVNDYKIDLFEGLYKVPNGMSYNSYVILDDKIAVMDTVDTGFTDEWLKNVQFALKDKKPDYLIVQHMEPDHSSNILKFMEKYPEAFLVASSRAFVMMKNYFGIELAENKIVVDDGDILSLGKHVFTFFTAPMVHWPEVIVTYDSTDKVLFSADAFGRFGAVDMDGPIVDEKEWEGEARRYYFGIVGKYGLFVQKLLNKLKDLEIQTICPLHGPILNANVEHYLKLYQAWSSYEPGEDGVMIAYTSVYGNTKKAVMMLIDKIVERLHDGEHEKDSFKVCVYDLTRCDMSEAVADAFKYGKLVLATTTYNAELFPPMREFISALTERNFSNRFVAFIENGSWAPIVAKLMKERLEKCKDITFAKNTVRMVSALNDEGIEQLEELVKEIVL